MDVTWFICMELVFLRQYIDAMVAMNLSTTLKQSQTGITSSGASQSFQIRSHTTSSQVYETVSSTSEISSSSIYMQETGSSTLKETKTSVPIEKSSSIIIPPNVSEMTSSSYVPILNESSTLKATKTSVPIEKSSSIIIPPNVSEMTSSSYVPILNESSTLKATKTSVPIEKSSSIIIPPNVSEMTSSSYVPILNDKKKKSDGIPLIILIPSAAGGGIFLILIIILCCCVNRVLKRKKNRRIFQKYYRPTRSSDLSHDIEDNNSNVWVSQVTKPSVERNEEQSIDSKYFKGISNKGFLKAESLPEMNIFQEQSPSNLSVNISTDTDQQNLNKVKEDIEEINESSEDCKSPMKKIPETATVADDKASKEEKPSCNDNNKASLLVLQNLDNILNDECPQDKPETSDAVTSLGDDQDKLRKGGYCVVMYSFEASKPDEISLEVDTMVVAIESKPSGWSWVVNKDDNTGWCPTQYLLRVETHKEQDECEDVQTDHRSYSIPDQRRLKFAVLQSFFGTSPNELSLSKYDIVTVIKNSSSGWSWVTKPSVGSGWFPTDYLEPLIFPKNETSNSSNESSKYLDVINEDLQYASSEEIQKVKKEGHYQEYEAKAYRATHPYTGSKEDELTFKENETILVLQESETGWWRGSTFLGEGWFPATFVEDPINEDPSTTPDPHECVEPPKYQEKDAASPYEVTELVTKKGQTKKESDREMVHQVPQVIPSNAAKKHKNRGRGKASNLKPCRPAPPPPPGERLLDGQSSPQQSVFSFTPDVSPVSQLSTCQVDAPPRAPLLPEVNPVDLIQSPGKVPSYITVLPPSPLPEDVHANIQEDSDSVDNVEGVVIVPSRDQSQNTLSKLIKVTKRRSVINPNPHATPPSRPVPVPPPRKARSPQKSADKLPRPRPIKAPRNLSNKNPDPQNIRNVPEDVPERPPPPVPEKLEEFLNKRLSSGERSLSQLQSSNIPREQSENVKNNGLDQSEQDGNNHHNQCNESELETCSQPNPKQRNGKARNFERSSENLQDEQSSENLQDEQSSKNKQREKRVRTSPKPRTRQRSQDQQFDLDNNNSLMQQQRENDDPNTNSNQNLENPTATLSKMPHLSEQSSPGERRDSAPEVSPRSRSICDQSSDNQPKIRPQIKPRSKSLANLFSSDNEEKNAEDNGSSDSEKRFRLHSSPEDESRQSQSSQRPKPKTRAK